MAHVRGQTHLREVPHTQSPVLHYHFTSPFTKSRDATMPGIYPLRLDDINVLRFLWAVMLVILF